MITDIEKYREEIEATKFALSSVPYMNISIKQTVCKTLQWLYTYYKVTQDESYLLLCIVQTQAFLEMGFTYDLVDDIVDTILSELGADKFEVFPKRFYHSEKVRLNKNQIKKMIRRWSPSKYHSKPIGEVIDDIIEKVKNQEKGVYFYHSNNNPNIPEADSVYELVINDEESFFYDVERKKYYTFIL